MLPNELKPLGFDTWQKEEWEEYRTRLQLPDHEATLQFFRQVVYDHFEHFNYHYPEFHIDNYAISIEQYTAEQAVELVRFFRGEVMDWWGAQYDDFETKDHDYLIFQAMSKKLTFPFPPILVQPDFLASTGHNACGRPLHLIEGTHRFSYLRHMLSRGLIKASSVHDFVVLRPNGTDA